MKKIGRFWRIAIALVADAICVVAIGGLHITRAPGSYHFRVSAASLGPGHILALVVVLYLSVVAVSGRWWPFRRGG